MLNLQLIFLSVLLVTSPLLADELDDALLGFDEPTKNTQSVELDDVLDGFDDSKTEEYPSSENSINTSISLFSLRGYWGFSTSYNIAHSIPEEGAVDYRGLSKVKFSANIMSDFEIYSGWKAKMELQIFTDAIYVLNGKDRYNDDILSTYESEISLNEAYLSGSLSKNLDLKFGQQIVVWGKSDNIRVTDVINPLNNREPGMVDIEDLRIPVLMTKLSYYAGDWSYTLMALHEQRNPQEAAIDSEFFPLSALPFPVGFIFPDVDKGSINFSNTTFAFAAAGRFSGWDLSFYAGRVTDSRWHFENNKTERHYGPIDMTGIAGNIVLKGFLLKAEVAYINDLIYNTTTTPKSRIDGLIGVEYMGITDWVLSAEFAKRKIYDYESQMINSPDMVKEVSTQLSIRLSYSFDHDNATISLLSTAMGNDGEEGGFNRLWVDYALNDQVELSAGLIDYMDGSNPIFAAISNNDRLFMNIRYNF